MISYHRGNRGGVFLFRLRARCIAGRRLGIFFGMGAIRGLGGGTAENGGFFVGGVLGGRVLRVFIVGEGFGDCVPVDEGGGDGLGEFGDFLAGGLGHEGICRDLGVWIVGDYHG